MTNQDKEYLDLVAKVIKAEIKAGNDMLSYQITEITKRQDVANGKLEKHDKILSNRHLKVTSLVVISVVLTLVLNAFGILEFLKLIK